MCPNNKKLVYCADKLMKSSTYERYNNIYKFNDCDDCLFKDKCTTNKTGRTIIVNEENEIYKKIVRDNC